MIPFDSIDPREVGLTPPTLAKFVEAQRLYDGLARRLEEVGPDRASAEYRRRSEAAAASFLEGAAPGPVPSESSVQSEYDFLRSSVRAEQWKAIDDLRPHLERISSAMIPALEETARREQSRYDDELRRWGCVPPANPGSVSTMFRTSPEAGEQLISMIPPSPTSPAASVCRGLAIALRGDPGFRQPSVMESISRTWGSGGAPPPNQLLMSLTSWSLRDLENHAAAPSKPSLTSRALSAIKNLSAVPA